MTNGSGFDARSTAPAWDIASGGGDPALANPLSSDLDSPAFCGFLERNEAGTGRVSVPGYNVYMVVADRLPGELRNRNAGVTYVKDVKVELREDSSEEPAFFVVLVLSDPPTGHESWPIDDLWALRRITREVIDEIREELEPNWNLPWFIVFEPEHPELLNDDDELPFADN
jgi:hypothetical protein